MSELKAFDIVVAEEYYCEGIVKYRRAVYDKSEADKVIAELKEKLDLYKRGFKEDDKTIAYLYAELRHSNYKRCLAMANYCYTNVHCIMGHRHCAFNDRTKKWFDKWEKRWLELAQKFKEAK